MRPDLSRVMWLASVWMLTACPAPSPSGQDAGTLPPPSDAGPGGEGQADAGSGADAGVTSSSRNHLRFKGPERLTSDFAQALSLPEEQVCNELGQYSCTRFVHTVTLGGVAPYDVGLYEPLPASGVTSPIAVDRVALAACARRVSLDLATPSSAAIFGHLPLDGQGRLVFREGQLVRDVVTALYQRGLQRDPTWDEVDTLVRLAADIEATGSPSPGRDWMTAVCFVVLSSAESVFF